MFLCVCQSVALFFLPRVCAQSVVRDDSSFPALPAPDRFVYHGTAGSKVDAPVTFPLELDPRLVSRDCHVTESLALAACVCHFGCKWECITRRSCVV